MRTNMWEYQNGNYTVRIEDDGTKTRLSDNPIPEIPESMDVKVTNRCNGGCAFCHEMSTPDGDSFNLDDAMRLFRELPHGVELAIGGGNPLEVRAELDEIMCEIPDPIYNVTLNAKHLKDLGDHSFNAIGVSYGFGQHDLIKKHVESDQNTQYVMHLIAGVHDLNHLEKCLDDFDRVLVLGYKEWGRGKDFYSSSVEQRLKDWSVGIGKYLHDTEKIVAFDNLAIRQLDIGRFFSDEKWNEIYMGDDGQFTMYLDLVKMEYAKSSFSPERYSCGEKTLREMFAHIRSL